MWFDKEMTAIMKGYGILFIALHNFLHLEKIAGFVRENENTFVVQRTWDYLGVLKSFQWSDIGQFFSFLGWIGVPVFLFLSGFGLVKKYSKSVEDFHTHKYLYHSWKKLAFLLFPGVLFFVILSFIHGTWMRVVPKCFLQLSLLNNLFIPKILVIPRVYWYFGLTFELYLLYLLVRRWDVKRLLGLCLALLIVQIVTIWLWGPNSNPWSWVRHNFLGWGHVFLIGMIVAKTNVEKYLPNNGLFLFIISVLCLISIIVSSLNVWTWLLIVPFVALLFFVFFAGTIKNTKILKNIGLWLGKYSAFIFVAHPIARSLVLVLFKRVHLSCWQLTAIYMVLSLVGAIVYKIVYQAMMNVRVCEKRQ